VKHQATWWTSVPVVLTEGRQWPGYLISPTNSDFSRSAGLRCVWALDVDLHLCDEHNITNVSAQIDNVPVPAVTYCSGTLATMTGAALAVTVSTALHINVTLSLLTLDSFIAPTPGRITTELSRPASRAHLSIGVGRQVF